MGNENFIQNFSQKPEWNRPVGDTCVDGRIILKLVLKGNCMNVSVEFKWFSGGLLQIR